MTAKERAEAEARERAQNIAEALGLAEDYGDGLYIADEHLDTIASAILAAEARGRAEEREACANVVTENFQLLCTEHRLLLMNRAIAIRARTP